ncbi:MAG: hypothetical protein LBJ13_04035 [Puniceicoccales bacterium]|nr:hypothetical protein [Puniceicoccales bacterium]
MDCKLVRNWIKCVLGCLFFKLGIIPAKANFLSFLIKKNEDTVSIGKKSEKGSLKIVVKPKRQTSIVFDKTAHADGLSTDSMKSKNKIAQFPNASSATVSAGSQKREASLALSTEGTKRIPLGYEIKNVPGDGLCGYWAVLVAEAAIENEQNGKNISIHITKKNVFDLLKRLSDRIAYTIHREDKTDTEQKMVAEIDQLIRDRYGNNREALCQKIEAGSVQLDSPLLLFLAQEIGYDIFVNWSGKMRDGSTRLEREQYASGCADAKRIRIDYSGNGSAGHYQAIIPVGMNVRFN